MCLSSFWTGAPSIRTRWQVSSFVSMHKQRRFERFLKFIARYQPIWDRPLMRRLLDHLTKPFMRRLAETARLSPQLVMPRLARRHLRDRYPELILQAGQAVSFPGGLFPWLRGQLLRRWGGGCRDCRAAKTWGRAGSADATLFRDADRNLRASRVGQRRGTGQSRVHGQGTTRW